MAKAGTPIRVGIDIGGTFTDFVVFQPKDGSLQTFKLLSTPDNPARAVIEGIHQIRHIILGSSENDQSLDIVHGSTVATNALLERKGARTALIATRGFRDILQIGRQNRPQLYDLTATPPPPLVPEELRLEVTERISSEGEVIQALDPAEIDHLVPLLKERGAESVAVCLLFSFLIPEHEQIIGKALREADFHVSLSSEILPEYREFERASTTTVNAYVSPMLERYLTHLEASVTGDGTRLQVMQSNGGQISIDEARRNGVRCILSGPAGGVVGAQAVAQLASAAGSPATPIKVLTFDMGGTSTDVSLIDGSPTITTESTVGGLPIRIPVLDIHTIGAGGGSIATVDAGGALRVGPESAGADPGPACYGRSDPLSGPATVTDANLVLGRLQADQFLGGKMPLDHQRAWDAVSRSAQAAGLSTIETGMGIIEVVNAHMERALRVISVERGYDPRDFSLLSFGGAGGLHAADLARRLNIRRVIVPPLASTLSAFGMLQADVVKDYTQTIMLPGNSPIDRVALALAPLIERGTADIYREGISLDRIRIEPSLDMRYEGQSYEINVPWREGGSQILCDFHAAHHHAYGYAREDAPVEIVNARVRAIGLVQPPGIVPLDGRNLPMESARIGTRPVVLSGTNSSVPQEIPLYRFEYLQPGDHLSGPALIVREDTSVMISPDDQVEVDAYQNLLIMINANRR